MAECSQPSRWSDLPPDVVVIISEKIADIADFVRFRHVCKSWRSASKPHTLSPLQHLPWLLLPYNPRSNQRSFLSLSNLSVRTLDLPKTRDRIVCGSSNGWLVLLSQTLNISLLNPLSKCLIPLPQITAVPDQSVRVDAGVACFVRNPYSNSERMLSLEELDVFFDCYAFLSPNVFGGVVAFVSMKSPKILYWRQGLNWTELDLGLRGTLMTMAFHNNRFYAIDGTGNTAVCALGPGRKGSVVGSLKLRLRHHVWHRYLVALRQPDELLLVSCRKTIRPGSLDDVGEGHFEYRVDDVGDGHFEYRVLDEGRMTWLELGGVRDCTVFLTDGMLPGKEKLITAARSAPGYRKNCLYCVVPRRNGQGKGQQLSRPVIIEDSHLKKYHGPWENPNPKLQSSSWITPRLN